MADHPHESAFCELIKLAFDHAPDAEAKREMASLLVKYCSGVDAQGDAGNAPASEG